MRKLSEINADTIDARPANMIPCIDRGESESWQALILFDNVLDTEKILNSPEIDRLVKYLYGKRNLELCSTNYPEDLHDWLRDELYKAEINDQSILHRFKVPFEDFTLPNHSSEFSGELLAVMFKPTCDGERDFLVLTCVWDNGMFRNDNYIVGVIADTDELADLIDTHIRR